MLRDKILSFANQYLSINQFPDVCVNGLQIEGKKEIKKIVTGVSANMDLIKAAIKQNADMIMVHHGLFWGKKLFDLTGIYKDRLQKLLEYNINLATYHLPLDAHPVIGNNILILKELGLKFEKKFSDIGMIGNYQKEVKFKDFVRFVNKTMKTDSYYIDEGKEKIKRVAVLSGGGCKFLDHAIAENVDVYLTGDIKEFVPATCKEAKINFINAWHHNTEIFGIQELGNVIAKKFKVSVNFVNIENEV